MLKFTTGNLLDSEAEALVNTVNTVGVMGKGIALQFKNQFPSNYKIYAKPFYYLESDNQLVLKNTELDDDSFNIEK